MRISTLNKLGDVITMDDGTVFVVSDLDVECRGTHYYSEWVKLCPLLPTADSTNVLRMHRDYERSFQLVLTVDVYGSRVHGVNVPKKHSDQLRDLFLKNRRIKKLLRCNAPHRERLRAEAEGIERALASGWL